MSKGMLNLAGLAIVTFIVVLAVSTWTVRGPRPQDAANAPEPTGDARNGAIAMVAHGCGSCHVIPGIRGADGMVGPPLGGVAGRDYVAGSLITTPENLARWIREPQSIEPGTAMPNLGVSLDDARDMTAYLYELERR